MANNTWLRLYTDIINDRKIRRLPIPYKWVWIIMLCMAKESPQEGKLLLSENVPVNLEDISDYAQVEIEEIKKAIDIFKKFNMVHEEGDIYVITNWNKRQYVSDNSTERWKRWYEKSKKSNVGQTLENKKSNVGQTPPDTDSDTYTDTEYIFINNKVKKNLNLNNLGGKNEKHISNNGEFTTDEEYSRWLEGTEDIPTAYIPEFLRKDKESESS